MEGLQLVSYDILHVLCNCCLSFVNLLSDICKNKYILKTCLCNVQRLFSAVKTENFIRKTKHRLWVHLTKVVLTSAHKPCFESKIRKLGIPQCTPVLLNKRGV